MTDARFRTVRREGSGLLLPTVDALLDALEAGRLGPEDQVFDVQLQRWMPVKAHPELRAAWADRQRFQPHDDRSGLERLPDATPDYPMLDDEGVTPAHGTVSDDLAVRRAAFRALRLSPPPVRADSLPAPLASPDLSRAETLYGYSALLAVLVLLGVVGVAIVGLASGIGRMMSLGVGR